MISGSTTGRDASGNVDERDGDEFRVRVLNVAMTRRDP